MKKEVKSFKDNETIKLHENTGKEPPILETQNFRTKEVNFVSSTKHLNPKLASKKETQNLPSQNPQTPLKTVKLKPPKPTTTAKSVSFFGMFKFATKLDVLLMILAAIFSSLQGIVFPLMTIFFADFAENLSDSVNIFDSRAKISKIVTNMLYLGSGVFISSFMAIVLWSKTACRQMKAFRSKYLLHLLFKNAAWFDREKAGTLSHAYFDHNAAVIEIYSTKLHLFFQIIATLIAGFLVAFYRGWLLSLLIVAASPIMVIGLTLYRVYTARFVKLQNLSYARAGAISDQSFEYIRGVRSLNGQAHESDKYVAALQSGFVSERKEGWKGAFFYALFNISWSFVYALAFLIGNYAVGKGWHNHNTGKTYAVGDFLAVLLGVITGISSISLFAPVNQSLSQGQAALGRVNQIVNLENQESSGGLKPQATQLKGEIVFQNVTFAYPSAPDRPVLRNISFVIKPGEKFAIVGPSGSGKSTIIQLIERFYDPQQGKIFFDGTDIQDFDLAHYRKLLGLVSQQPILFANTIRANMLIGLEDSNLISESKILDALEQANVKQLITEKLEKGLETYVGTSGAQLSGGQKQRISIARVLLREPKLFLFDEATSALDRQNEKEIQESIDRLSKKTTSISIAHRLVTIKNSDQIVVLVDGQIEESGKHTELINIPNGVYQDLYSKQGSVEEKEEIGEVLNGKQTNQNHSTHPISSNNLDAKIELREDDDKTKQEKKEKKPAQTPVFMSIYHLLSGKDICFIVIAVISSGFLGAVMPFIGIIHSGHQYIFKFNSLLMNQFLFSYY